MGNIRVRARTAMSAKNVAKQVIPKRSIITKINYINGSSVGGVRTYSVTYKKK